MLLARTSFKAIKLVWLLGMGLILWQAGAVAWAEEGKGVGKRQLSIIEAASGNAYSSESWLHGVSVRRSLHSGVNFSFLTDQRDPVLQAHTSQSGWAVTGGQAVGQFSSDIGFSATVLRSGVLLRQSSPALEEKPDWLMPSFPHSQWRGRSSLWPAFTSLSGSGIGTDTLFLERSSFVHSKITARRGGWSFEAERAQAGREFRLADPNFEKKLTASTPLPLSVAALTGGQVTRLGLGFKAKTWGMQTRLSDFKGGGEVKRQEIALTTSPLEFRFGRLNITNSQLVSAAAAQEQKQLLNAAFAEASKSKVTPQPSMQIGDWNKLGTFSQRDYLGILKLSQKDSFKAEGNEISGTGGQLRQQAIHFSLFGGRLMMQRKTEEVGAKTDTGFLQAAGFERLVPRIGTTFQQSSGNWKLSQTAELNSESSQLESQKGRLKQSAVRLSLMGGQLVLSRHAEQVAPQMDANFLKAVGFQGLTPRIGQAYNQTNLQWKLAPNLALTQTMSQEKALPGSAPSVVKERESMQTALNWQPDRVTQLTFSLGSLHVLPKTGKPLMERSQSLQVNRPLGLWGYRMGFSHLRRSIHSDKEVTQSQTYLVLRPDDKARLKVGLEVLRNAFSNQPNLPKTTTKLSLSSRLAEGWSFSGNWQRLPKGMVVQKVGSYSLVHEPSKGLRVAADVSTNQEGKSESSNAQLVIATGGNAAERIMHFSQAEVKTAQGEEIHSRKVGLVQALSPRWRVAATLSDTDKSDGKSASEQGLYLETIEGKKHSSTFRVGYLRLKPFSGEEIKIPVMRWVTSPLSKSKLSFGYALHYDPQQGSKAKVPMRELGFQVPLGKQGNLLIARFTNMPNNWLGLWNQKEWFSRARFATFPQLLPRKELALLEVEQYRFELPIAKGLRLVAGWDAIENQANRSESQNMRFALHRAFSQNESLKLEYIRARDEANKTAHTTDVCGVSYARRLSGSHNLTIQAQLNDDIRVARAGIFPDRYHITLVFSTNW